MLAIEMSEIQFYKTNVPEFKNTFNPEDKLTPPTSNGLHFT
jgi:hypothetical protein